MLNKFHVRYTAVFLESHDCRSPSIQDFETTWWSPVTASNVFFQIKLLWLCFTGE